MMEKRIESAGIIWGTFCPSFFRHISTQFAVHLHSIVKTAKTTITTDWMIKGANTIEYGGGGGRGEVGGGRRR